MAQSTASTPSKPSATARLTFWMATAGENRRVVLLCRLGLAAYLLMLVAATHFPPRHLPRIRVPDKLGHFAAYCLLAALAVAATMSISAVRRMQSSGWILLSISGVLLLACLGLCDEWTQPLVGRHFEWLDWAADVAGATTGAAAATFVARKVQAAKVVD